MNLLEVQVVTTYRLLDSHHMYQTMSKEIFNVDLKEEPTASMIGVLHRQTADNLRQVWSYFRPPEVPPAPENRVTNLTVLQKFFPETSFDEQEDWYVIRYKDEYFEMRWSDENYFFIYQLDEERMELDHEGPIGIVDCIDFVLRKTDDSEQS